MKNTSLTMANTIKHQGVIKRIQGTHVQVRITQTSACASCSIKGHCTSADTKEKMIDVFDSAASQYQVGQEVWVVGTLSMGVQAVLFAFILPLVILVTSIFFLMNVLEDELLASCGSMTCVAVYYLLLKILFKEKLRKRMSFIIQH